MTDRVSTTIEAPTASPKNPTGTAENPTESPVRPRPKLFVALCVIFAAWVGFMIWMYAATVRPMRHDRGAEGATPAARAESPRAESR